MEGPIVPPPDYSEHNVDGDANQPNHGNDSNASAGPPNAPPNQPPNQPALQQPPNHLLYHNSPPNQPVPQQPLHGNLFCGTQPLR